MSESHPEPATTARHDLPLADLWPVLIVWLVLALLPLGRISELPLLVGAVWGVWLYARRGRELLQLPAARLTLAVFACYWAPALISALDAVEPGKTWSHVLGLLRFLPFALFVAATLRSQKQWNWLLRSCALLIAFWVLDGWMQAFTGRSLGGTMDSDRLSGIFGADNLKLGGALAALSPLLLAYSQHRFGLRGVFVAGLLLAGVILLAGARAAWLVYLLVLAGWCLRPFGGKSSRALALAFALVAAGALMALVAYQTSPEFAARMDRTLHLTHGEEGALDYALAGRLPIWHTSVAMAREHPINGVGVRGFRHAYADHAEPDDPWLESGGGMHPHQLLLELVTETGLLGLLAWLLGAVLLWRAWRRCDAAAHARSWPLLLALMAMCFPLNTHYAFYSSWWGLFFWWWLAVTVAVLHLRREADPL